MGNHSNDDVGKAVGKAVSELLFGAVDCDWSCFRLNVNVNEIGDDQESTEVLVALEIDKYLGTCEVKIEGSLGDMKVGEASDVVIVERFKLRRKS